MLFPSATVDSLQVRVLLIRPHIDSSHPIEVIHRMDTTIGESRTTIEERRPTRSALLLSQRCTLTLVGNAADDWRKGLAALGPRPVAMPLWVDALPVARWSERIYDAEKVINFDPSSGAFAIYDRTSLPGSPAYPLYAPLLIGRWSERPEANVQAAKFAEVDVLLNEASPYTCRVGVHPQGSSWSAAPDWSERVKDRSDYGLELVALGGSAREPGLDRTNAAARWRQEAGFTFRDRLAIRQALTWFVAKQGATLAWDIPAWFQPGADTTYTPSSYHGRFASDSLSLRYVSGSIAKSTIGLVQQVDTGARNQALPGEAFLYRLTYQHDPGHPERYTNWDAPLTFGSASFAPSQCNHKEILLSLRPQDQKADLSLAFAADSLAADWIVGRLFGWVRLEAWSCNPADPDGSAQNVFTGFVVSVLPEGNTLTLTATLLGKRLDRSAPSDVFGKNCNTYVFSPRCGLNEADYRCTGTIVPDDLSSDGLTLTVPALSGGTGGPYADGLFAPSGILRTGEGRSRQVVTIVASVMSGGGVVLTLQRPLWRDLIASGGQAAQLVPGCGGQYVADCTNKFANADNFRGEPFIPDYIEQAGVAASAAQKK